MKRGMGEICEKVRDLILISEGHQLVQQHYKQFEL